MVGRRKCIRIIYQPEISDVITEEQGHADDYNQHQIPPSDDG
jgi:hypothetical protein